MLQKEMNFPRKNYFISVSCMFPSLQMRRKQNQQNTALKKAKGKLIFKHI
uniref:Alternative protein TBC1D8B n=1 Tax=Homo sapiens TaxID=9606 RepID=L8EAY1_HUMAN|nr:alternative protein TBC1D8B [Homo sapiens]